MGGSYSRLITIALAVALISVLFERAATAQDHRQGEPGRFDFYVLTLSWSPSYCEAAEDRSRRPSRDQQCGGRPFAFVVHGLWPQYERGFPSYCQVPAPRLDHRIVGRMLDLMPSPRLVFHEWDRHGTCSGLTPRDYFATIRKAREAVKIPPEYAALDKPALVAPDDIVSAFIKANPAMTRESITVACDGKRLTEVRICLTQELSFRGCPNVSRRNCRRDHIAMPAVRGR